MKNNQKISLRMCIVCKKIAPKNEMIRIVKTPEGLITIDKKANGRGAYVCDNFDCMKKCKDKRLLNKAYKMNIDEKVYEKLMEEYARYKQN